ncbi:MAG: acyltransferase family protein [Acetatifactor sp.]|nr:acyltransferase family protein [Acetatifactor sp.]
MKEERLNYLDMLKGIGIVLVVLGHTPTLSEDIRTWIISFHMPLFFIVSGILFAFKDSSREPFRPYLSKRFKSTMIPYFWFSLLNIGIDVCRLYVRPENVGAEVITEDILQTFSFFGISVLWFLSTAFLGELCLYGLLKKCPPWLIGIIGIVSLWLPAVGSWMIKLYFPMEGNLFLIWLGYLLMMLLRVLTALVFLLVGYVLYWWLKRSSIKAVWEIVLGFCCLILNVAAAFANGMVDLHYLVYQNVLLYYLAACSAVIGLVLICRHVRPFSFLLFLGRNSLIIMLTHIDCQVMNLSIRFATAMSERMPTAGNIMFRVWLYLALLIGELLLIWLINRFGFFLLGKRKPVIMED